MARPTIVLSRFREAGHGKYVTVQRFLPYAVLGAIAMLILTFVHLHYVLEDPRFPKALVISIPWFVSMPFFGLVTAMGLFSITTEIDLRKRRLSITKRNFRGQRVTASASLDDIVVSADWTPRSPGAGQVSVHQGWTVKAGIQNEEFNAAIVSHETATEQERNQVMLELYHFFFPDRTDVNEKNILTDGKQAYVLSGAEKEEFLRKREEAMGGGGSGGEETAFEVDIPSRKDGEGGRGRL